MVEADTAAADLSAALLAFAAPSPNQGEIPSLVGESVIVALDAGLVATLVADIAGLRGSGCACQ